MEPKRTGPGTTGQTTTGPVSVSDQPMVVTALFRNRDQAEQAYQALEERGYTSDDVSILMSDETRQRDFSTPSDTNLGSKAAEGAGIGGAIGGTLGALAAALAAVGSSIALPGLGLVVAGPLAAALAGAGAGAATGGLLGALIGAGIPEDRARQYESGVKQGGIVLGVRPRSIEDATELEREWLRAGGEQVFH